MLKLRPDDYQETLSGTVTWFIGRSRSGKSTLLNALQKQVPKLIGLDDHLRVRAGILGKDRAAYDGMISLAWALAYQGFDVAIPCGGETRALRDYLRSIIPTSRFIYIAERGRIFADYEEPQPDEQILILNAAWSLVQEVHYVMEVLWHSTKNS